MVDAKKYRLRNEQVFTASQWHKPGDHPAVTHRMLAQGRSSDYGFIPDQALIVCPGDWIVTDERTRIEVLTAAAFEKKYVQAATDEPAKVRKSKGA